MILKSEGSLARALTIPVGKSYCWQVALQQSLLPLQTYARSLINIPTKVTNHFSVHYQKNTPFFEFLIVPMIIAKLQDRMRQILLKNTHLIEIIIDFLHLKVRLSSI
jgi:hypothetical protein